MLKGAAVESFTLMFLQMWNVDEREPKFPQTVPVPEIPAKTEGFVIPYADCPLDDNKIGEMVYIDLLNRATQYAHIMTPYLILDGEMETALKFAAQRGVDVKIILPGIPDKRIPYALAKTHYRSLLRSGVQIYEYTPGFVHAKVFSVDGKEAVVGTINLDYRSLYHHFENGCFIVDNPAVLSIRHDLEKTMQESREVTEKYCSGRSAYLRLGQLFMRLFAGLL